MKIERMTQYTLDRKVARLEKLKQERASIEQAIEDKHVKDIANYGVSLGNGGLIRKLVKKREVISEVEALIQKVKTEMQRKRKKKLEKSHLTRAEKRILGYINENNTLCNTSSDGTKFDQRFYGSISERKRQNAWWKRGK